ncbi:hypothetical protein LCGC14_2849540 [marine sediment metagenome]|uniref:Uncharacterized protein n=1 Tax=marine sediment metagenome TaxID=412755 RepID=A0A0F9AZQ1_9ZZZZ|nr:hypothetical protein [bacterium]
MGLFIRRKTKTVEEPEQLENKHGLIGFKGLEKISFHNYNNAYKWGSFFVLAKMGACWRLYTKEGYPMSGPAHTIKLGTFGDLECSVGAHEFEIEMHDKVEEYQGLKRMINTMIDEREKNG